MFDVGAECLFAVLKYLCSCGLRCSVSVCTACLSVQRLPSNPVLFLLSLNTAQRPTVSDIMLTTLQKALKKRCGLAVTFLISQRRTRS